MRQLAFIRLLYLQAMSQAQLPEPLMCTSLLTFHDAVELFLVLASDHLGVPPRGGRDPNFMEYWRILAPTNDFSDGVQLSSQHGMDRLNRHRNALKHAGAMPGMSAVQDAVRSVTSFFEDNTPRVFVVEFSGIDMADVVPQADTQSKLKAASVAESAGDRVEAMALLGEAFNRLFHEQVKPFAWRGPYAFGPNVDRDGFFGGSVSEMFQQIANALRNNHSSGIASTGQKLSRRVEQLSEAVPQIQQAMRVMALGIDYSRYARFERLTPRVFGTGEHRRVSPEPGYAPNQEEYEYCMQFVITAALRMAELEAQSLTPSWRASQ